MTKKELRKIIKEEIETFVFSKGTMLKKDGIPVFLHQDTEIETHPNNLKLMTFEKRNLKELSFKKADLDILKKDLIKFIKQESNKMKRSPLEVYKLIDLFYHKVDFIHKVKKS